MDLRAPVSSIMTPNPIFVKADAPLMRVQEIFDAHKIHHLPVLEKGKMVGIISKTDLLYFLKGLTKDNLEEVMNEVRLRTFHAGQIMSKGIVSISSAVKLSQAIGLFYRNDFHAIPIVDNDELVGILTTHDIIKTLMEEHVLPTDQKM